MIIWTNDGIVCWCIYASLGGLKKTNHACAAPFVVATRSSCGAGSWARSRMVLRYAGSLPIAGCDSQCPFTRCWHGSCCTGSARHPGFRRWYSEEQTWFLKKKKMQKCHSQQGWRQGDERVITQLSMHWHDTSVVTRGPVWDKSYASGYLVNSIGEIILDQAGHSDQFIRLGQIYLANGNGTGGIVAHTNGHMAQ